MVVYDYVSSNDSNITNQSVYYYSSLEDVLETYGSTPFLDAFNMFPFTIVAVTSFLLSLLSFIVFMQEEFNTLPLYVYLRVYTLNNIFMCLPNLFNFTFSTYRYLAWSWSYEAQFYYNLVYTPIVSLSYFYASVLDIAILFDRLATFNKRARQLYRWPKMTCFLSFVACALINIPSYIQFEVAPVIVKLNETSELSFWFGASSSFALSDIGKPLILFNIAFRDGFTLLVELVLNIFSISLLKRYLSMRNKILNEGDAALSGNKNIGVAQKSVKQSKFSQFLSSRNQAEGAPKPPKVDLNITVMVTCMCFLSICEHALSFASFLYPYFYINLTTYIFYTFANFMAPLKRLIVFFIFYSYSRMFKMVCLRLLRPPENDVL